MPENLRETNLDAAIDLVNERHRYSRDAFTVYHHKVNRLYNSYRAWHSGQFQAFRNNVSVPLLYSVIWSDVARKMNTSFASNDVVDVFGYGPEDAPVARKNKILLNAQLKDAEVYDKAIDLITSADIYGTSIAHVGWKFVQREVARREGFNGPLSGKRFERVVTDDVVLFDGPNFDLIDIIDFFPQPNVPRASDLGWVVVRYTKSLQEVEQMVEDGIFLESGLTKIKIAGLRAETEKSLLENTGTIRHGNQQPGLLRKDKFANPIEFLELWDLDVPRGMAKDDRPSRVITVANGVALMRDEPNPLEHGQLPFVIYRALPDPHFLFGPGKVEMAEKLQAAASRLSSQKLDTLDLFADPAFYINSSAGIEMRNMFMRPGRIFEGDAPPGEAIMPISPDLRGTQNLYNEIEQLWSWLQQSTGIIEDTVQGGGASSRQTAREFLGRQENVSIRLLLESRIFEETCLEKIVQQFIGLNRQFLPTPRELKILGGNMTDYLTGQQVDPEERRIYEDELGRDYDVKARGATQVLPKAAKQQNWALLLQMITQNPLAISMLNWQAIFKETFRLFEVINHDEFLNVPPQQQQAIAQSAQLGILGGGKGANSPANAADETTAPPTAGFEGINATF